MLDYRSLFVFRLFGYLIRIKHISKDQLFSDRMNEKSIIFNHRVIIIKETKWT